jgi:hypothetical protein
MIWCQNCNFKSDKLQLLTTELRKESLNCDGQQFHEQQNEHLTLTHGTHKGGGDHDI